MTTTASLVSIIVGSLAILSAVGGGLAVVARGIWRMSSRATELNAAVRANTEATADLADQFKTSRHDIDRTLEAHDATLLNHEGRLTHLEQPK